MMVLVYYRTLYTNDMHWGYIVFVYHGIIGSIFCWFYGFIQQVKARVYTVYHILYSISIKKEKMNKEVSAVYIWVMLSPQNSQNSRQRSCHHAPNEKILVHDM
jgi:hypothetical protein